MTDEATTLPKVLERLRRLEDMEEIRRLYVDYGQHLDAGEYDEYAELFRAAREAPAHASAACRRS